MIEKGLLLSAYGLGGVFVSLIIFYLMVRLLVVLFPVKEENKNV
ncbi:MAG: OadG-related small transporter subunit [Bacillota bacterium]|nr:OadG-related small transporter subunit [Bacillota bacterium]